MDSLGEPVKTKEATANSGPRKEIRITGVQLKIVGESLSVLQEFSQSLNLTLSCEGSSCRVCFLGGLSKVFEVLVREVSCVYQAGSTTVVLRVPQGSAVVTTLSQNDTSLMLTHFHSHVRGEEKKSHKQSVFSLRTEEASSKQYFQFYGYLSQQQNMMQDYVRTSTYQSAMLQNTADFKDKVVMDVGAGTGILSFFAVQAGAKKVYAVEASSIAVHCARLVKANGLADKITVIAGKVEEVDIPEQIDMIISEPMGYMLYNERMIESYLHAKKWLKPGGKMFPSKGILYAAPFNDEALYSEQVNKSTFWTQTSFHGVNVSELASTALEEYIKQPILDMCDIRIILAKPVAHTTDFLTTNEADLHRITIPLSFTLWSTGLVHGLAFWFDVSFCGSQCQVWLSTAPTQPLTHWYQIRCLFPQPVFCNQGQVLTGSVILTANERQSYDIDIEISVKATAIHFTSSYDLKNPNFRYMSGMTVVPGTQHDNPTDSYFDSLDVQHMSGHDANDSRLTGNSLIGLVAPTRTVGDSTPLMNGGIPSSPSGQYTMNQSVYQQIPVSLQSNAHMIPMSQTVSSQSVGIIGAGYPRHSMGGSQNQVYYNTSIAHPSGGGGVSYRAQQLQTNSQIFNGHYHPYNVGLFRSPHSQSS